MIVLTRGDVRSLLDVRTCTDAVEEAFKLHAQGTTFGQGVLGVHVAGGGFHMKAAARRGSPAYFAAKINANFPGNRAKWNLPTIQGVVILFDAGKGTPLAVMDSMEITTLRTAAASAVAAKYLSRIDSRVLSIIGCGVQGRGHLIALASVRDFTRVLVHDQDSQTAQAFVSEMSDLVNIAIESCATAEEAAGAGDVVVTCTPGSRQVLGPGALRAGSFLAAVGADSESKRELDPDLLAESAVVVDSVEQCAAIGELHHALAANRMTLGDVCADLGQVVSGTHPGRRADGEVVIFDSTGIAIQDVAAATVVYERAVAASRGTRVGLDDGPSIGEGFFPTRSGKSARQRME